MARYTVNYTALCDMGHVRYQNQDNLWCMGSYLECENNGLPSPIVNSANINDRPMFAVFDGMGGESRGDIAAYLAAKTFDVAYKSKIARNPEKYLRDTSEKMNDEICLYANINRTGTMGTTAAIIAFSKKEVYICNIGDSKIFLHNSGNLTQVSQDHAISMTGNKKPALSQHLGIPKSEFKIEPFIAKGACLDGDRYLLCSDGLTDMVSVEEIEKTLNEKKEIPDCAASLMEAALSNGGIDNISIILCEIQKK